MSLASIRSIVSSDLEATDSYICNELKSEIPFINELVDYILKAGGKRIRPLMVLLAAKACEHESTHHIHLASCIELIHTATLLHDDVVDNSTLRRGRHTVNSKWGNQASVLVGDFLYSRAFQLILKIQNLKILDFFAEATNQIAEGEMLQLLNLNNPDVLEHSYYDVIRRKTAKLFEFAAQSAAALTIHNSPHVQAMQFYGMQLGIAYQLIDDALDYRSSTEEMGKNIGIDLAEGKPTLPLIYALQKCTPVESALIRKAIQKGSSDNLDSILSIIESTSAIEYTADVAKKHALESQASLAKLPDSPYRQGLHDLAEFVVERSY